MQDLRGTRSLSAWPGVECLCCSSVCGARMIGCRRISGLDGPTWKVAHREPNNLHGLLDQVSYRLQPDGRTDRLCHVYAEPTPCRSEGLLGSGLSLILRC
jgi:hypothetical protein